MTRRQTIVSGALVVLLALVVGMGTYIATRTLTDNTDAIHAIQADRSERIAESCAARHRFWLSQSATLDLIDNLVHQTAPDDPRIPVDLRALVRENLAAAEATLADARATLAPNDCITAVLP